MRTLPALSPGLKILLSQVGSVLPGAYLVGGGPRDLLLGREPVDLDFVVAGEAQAAADALAGALNAHAFPLDAERGQYRLVLADDAAIREIDLSSYGHDIDTDLRRRDFTINAMALPLRPDGSLGDLLDPTGGLADLEARRVRMVDELALVEDPLRLLRAARFAIELEFEIELDTGYAVQRHAALLNEVAAERRRDELIHILATVHAGGGFRLLDTLGLLEVLVPELMPVRGVEQPGRHHFWDVFDHSLETLSALDHLLSAEPAPDDWLARDFQAGLDWYPAPEYLDERCGGVKRRILLKLAGLLHDIAKPETKTIEPDGRVRFFGHPELGATKAEAICRRLRFGARETRFVSLLVDQHLRPTQLSAGDLPSHRAVHRFFKDLGDAGPACLFLCLADGAAAAGPRLQRERWRGNVAYMSYVLGQGEAQATIAARPRLLTGRDLIGALGLEQGPAIGRLMGAIEEAIAAGEVSTREEAIEYARRLLGDGQTPDIEAQP